jgi:histidinol-phosphate aminotransferase
MSESRKSSPGKSAGTPPLELLRAAIRAMPGYTPGEQVADLIKLNTNEGAFPPSPRVMEVLAGVASDKLRLYPDPTSGPLRAAAARRFGVAPDQVLAGNGSDDCLTILFRGFLDPGERVACPWPTYGLYETLSSIQGAELVRLPFVETGGRYQLPAALGAQGAKLVILANPNNPSATLVPVDELRRLADALGERAVLAVDEAYVDFALGAGLDASMLPYLDAHPNVVVLRTFSKSYSLAGARLGLMFAAAPIIEALTKVKDSYNVNALTQAIGVAALEDRAYQDEQVRRTLVERARLEKALAGFGCRWPASAANFLLVEIGEQAEAIYLALKRQGLLVRWWKTPELRTKLRISVGKPEENDRVIQALGAELATNVQQPR